MSSFIVESNGLTELGHLHITATFPWVISLKWKLLKVKWGFKL